MNLLNLSIRSVIRKPVKSILLFFIVFAAASFIYAGWACRHASVQTQNSGKQAIGGSFRLEHNEANRKQRLLKLADMVGEDKNGGYGGYHQEQLPGGAWHVWTDNSFESLSYDDIMKIAGADGILDVNITTANTVANPVNFKRIEDSDTDQNSDLRGVSLRGSLEMEFDFDVQSGNIVVKEGRLIHSNDENVCVISRELAQLNHLQLGDVLTFNDWKERETSICYNAEIIGIYDSVQKIAPIMSGDSYRAENLIFTDLRFPEKAEGSENDPLYQYAVFIVEDVDEYEQVRERIKAVDIDWEKYDFYDNTGMSDTMAKNFNELGQMSSLVLLFVIISGVLILLFVFLFWMKSRLHEIGVLLSVGRSKGMIVLQMLTEAVCIGAVAFLMATASAPLVSKGVADDLVGCQIQMAEEESEALEGMVSQSFTEEKDHVVGVTVELEAEVILFSAISTLGIIICAVSGSGIYVACQKPKDILSKMS